MDNEYILYCDESVKNGPYYSNFYGGVLVGSSHYKKIVSALTDEKLKHNLFGEVKWSKVTDRYSEKYIAFMKAFFTYVREGHLKVRIMFRQNAHEPNNLSKEEQKNSHFMLYYQFIKHAFGLEHAQLENKQTKLRLYFDQFPENREAASRFKGFLLALNRNAKIRANGFIFKEEDMTEVNSHDHLLLQCLDITLGAIHFRLNNKHLEKPLGSHRRAKRTVAKEKLYKSILEEIRLIKPEFKNFNIGNSTFVPLVNKWQEPYLHWNFIPKDNVYRYELTKGKK